MTAEQTIEGLEESCRELHAEIREVKTAVMDSELRILNRLSQVLAILDELTGETGERL